MVGGKGQASAAREWGQIPLDHVSAVRRCKSLNSLRQAFLVCTVEKLTAPHGVVRTHEEINTEATRTAGPALLSAMGVPLIY